jgi:WD40 repeat protein
VSQAGLAISSLSDRRLIRTIKLQMPNPHAVAFSPSGKQLAVGGGVPSEEGTIEVFTWPEGKPTAKFGDHTDSIMDIAWLNETRIASASLDKEVRLWDATTGQPKRTFNGHSRGVTSVRFLSDRKTLITAGVDQSIRVWNVKTGELIRSLSMHTKPIHDIAVRPAAAGLPMIASASNDRTVRLWQPTIGRMVRFAKLPARPLNVAWLPAGSHVVASCTDGRIYTIDPDTVEITGSVPAMSGWVWAMDIHRKTSTLVVGGPDGTIDLLKRSQFTRKPNDEQ